MNRVGQPAVRPLVRIVVLAVALVAGPTIATAEAAPAAVRLPGTRATLTLDPSWQTDDLDVAATAAGVIMAARRDGQLLVITRIPIPNSDAWRGKTRDAHVAAIERGLAASLDGQRLRSRKVHELAGVPVLDVEARRRDGTTVVCRVLLFRTYALALALEVPRRGELAPARAAIAAFTPGEPGA